MLIIELQKFGEMVLLNQQLAFFWRFNHEQKFSESQRVSEIGHQVDTSILGSDVITEILHEVYEELILFTRDGVEVNAEQTGSGIIEVDF